MGWMMIFSSNFRVLFLLILPTMASAGELGDFNRKVADAYAPYRSAVFYLRTGNPDVAFLELAAAQEHWRSVVDRFAKAPPDAFAGDDGFAESLTAVATALDMAITALDLNDEEHAAEALTPIRHELSTLRRRNGLHTFGDCVDEMNQAMDRLWVFRHKPPAFDQPTAVNAVKREAAVTEFLYRRCYDTAPTTLKGSGEFQRLFEGSLISLPQIFEALDQEQEGRLINILRELRSFDRMIWLQFG